MRSRARLAVVLLTLLAAYLGAYHAAFAWLGRALWRRGGAALLALPALWCVLEVVRSWMISGFPWNLAGNAWIAMPGALGATAWIGVYGVSFLLVVGQRRASATRSRGGVGAGARRRARRAAWSSLSRCAGRGRSPSRGAAVAVRIVQPNTPILNFADRVEIAAAYQKMLRSDARGVRPEGRSGDVARERGMANILERDAAFRADLEALAAQGCAILLNSPRFDGDRVYNSAFLIGRGKGATHYDKRHLVPFGEYVPLQQVLPFVGALARNAGSFAASDRISLLRFGPVTLGLAICFEITFPVEVAALVREGATALATLTNDAWYGDTAAPWQHLRAARFRAAENHRTVLRAALTGVSAWIEPDGSIASTMASASRASCAANLAPRRELTPFARAPWAVPIACLVAWSALLPLLYSAAPSARSREDHSLR